MVEKLSLPVSDTLEIIERMRGNWELINANQSHSVDETDRIFREWVEYIGTARLGSEVALSVAQAKILTARSRELQAYLTYIEGIEGVEFPQGNTFVFIQGGFGELLSTRAKDKLEEKYQTTFSRGTVGTKYFDSMHQFVKNVSIHIR